MVTYFLSEDGVTFHRVGRVSRFDAVKDEDPDHYYSVVENGKEVNCQSYYFTLDGLNYNARYVKVAFELTGTWAFADELEVRGTAAPSDTAETLPDTPGTDYEVVNKYAWTDQAPRHPARGAGLCRTLVLFRGRCAADQPENRGGASSHGGLCGRGGQYYG